MSGGPSPVLGVVGIGVAGLGVAGRAFLPAIAADPRFRLVAVADPDAEARATVAAATNAAAEADLAGLLARPEVEAVVIATPTAMHAGHAAAALATGRHVIVEKPMATRLEEAAAMVAAAEAAGRVLLVGHSHSHDLPVRRMREVIEAGTIGRVKMMHLWSFTDWVYRPRRPEELDAARGGGVTFRQGAHQVDILRLLGGGEVERVSARAFDWDPARPVTGAHTMMLDFRDGAVATAVYSGYGGLPGAELTGGVTEWGFPAPPPRPVPRRASGSDEAAAKRKRAGGTDHWNAPHQPHFGLLVVSGERGDLRQTPDGLALYTEAGREEIALGTDRPPHALVLAEFHDAVAGRAAALHDGRWGMANLEVCAAALRASETGAPQALHHQIAVRAVPRGGRTG